MADTKLYDPCRNGLHICGADPDELEPVTVANFPMRPAQAREAFAKLQALFGDEAGDMVVDLMIGSDIEADFWLRRQMFDRFKEAVVSEFASKTV